jgi:hypothetical protein
MPEGIAKERNKSTHQRKKMEKVSQTQEIAHLCRKTPERTPHPRLKHSEMPTSAKNTGTPPLRLKAQENARSREKHRRMPTSARKHKKFATADKNTGECPSRRKHRKTPAPGTAGNLLCIWDFSQTAVSATKQNTHKEYSDAVSSLGVPTGPKEKKSTHTHTRENSGTPKHRELPDILKT